jgi:N-acetylmuramoyl-L-alanine amidase
VALVPWDRAQVRHREDSTLLANLLEASLRAHIPMSVRPLQDVPLRVLSGLDAAGVVVEVAYLTNAEQEAAVRSGELPARAAQAVFEAVTAYRAARPGAR